MNKTIFAAIAAAVLIAGTVGTVAAVDSGSFLDINWTKTQVWNNNALEVRADMKASVPETGTAGAFGYAWLTKDLDNVLVVVTHKGIDDSAYDDPQSGFHTHVLDLMTPSPACSGYDLEVDLVGSAANSAFDPGYDYFVQNKRVQVNSVPAGDLGDAGVELVASFTVTPVEDSGLHLCVDVTDTV